ncbi:MAG: A/G-specific adenine glycosylase [Pseudomonadota bacterium]
MNAFSDRLLSWFDTHGRKDLPWQVDITAYRVWVSEIMLQQTQVKTVIPYYQRFLSRFPTVQSLAAADIDEVLELWAGLGYYARGRNLHRAAVHVVEQHGGEFPKTLEAMMALPGVGRSTAGAILSIAYQERHPILDGNVKRVLARHCVVDGWPGQTATANQLWAIAEDRTPRGRVADYTQAIMDLGATLCTRSKPDCPSCPVAADCQARLADVIEQYPGKKPRKAKPQKHATMVVAVTANAVFLERRPAAGIWGGLWSLPEVDNVDAWCRQMIGESDTTQEACEPIRHSFSHYDLDIAPVLVRVERLPSRIADSSDTYWYTPGKELPGGIAAPIRKFIDTLEFQNLE